MAFLGVDFEEEIYMHPLEVYFPLLQNGNRYTDLESKSSRKMVLLLRKSLYGLKQSCHSWYENYKDVVISIGFEASCVEGGMSMLHHNDERIVVAAVVLYVDDLLMIAKKGLTGRVKDQMKGRFRMHDLGSVPFDLGMNIERNGEHHTIDIHQHSYIRTILGSFRMDESRPVATPMAMKLHKKQPNKEVGNPSIYQLMIGILMSLMTATWPHMAYAIGVLSRDNHDSSNEDMIALKHVFWCLNGTKNW